MAEAIRIQSIIYVMNSLVWIPARLQKEARSGDLGRDSKEEGLVQSHAVEEIGKARVKAHRIREGFYFDPHQNIGLLRLDREYAESGWNVHQLHTPRQTTRSA